MSSLPPSVQSVLELFQGPLASVRFADIDAAGLAKLAAEVETASSELRDRESKLAELRQNLAQRQEALLVLAQQALAYARVYAENDEALLDVVNRISLPRAAKPRKMPASAKGTGARDAGSDPALGAAPAEADAAAPEDVGSEADAASEASTTEPANAEAAAAASPLAAPVARGPRKGRAAASQRAAN